ncbi:disulfide bond formation protein B [Vibrio coralliirubri]|uniref:disulfide bond formation protein B n=1 Tax=Vibrio coralliirubri TaxID=1516159 RepID=UPI0022835C2D|nr:disulfide bond formation protein B [Vibrio coralliirubri]MCY9866477.1 disulfide bond formation protein B [Vibrio coralliirubri]
MKIYSYLLNFSLNKLSWILLFSTSSFCVGASLFFQHSLNLAPCVMCIQERLFLMGIWIVSFAGIFYRKCIYFRGLVLASWLLLSAGGLKLSIEHLILQLNSSAFQSCVAQVGFPSFLPAHEWFPSLFMATGSCNESVWSLGGITMVQWIVGLFAINTALSVCFLIVELIASARHDGVWVNGIPTEEGNKGTYSGDH